MMSNSKPSLAAVKRVTWLKRHRCLCQVPGASQGRDADYSEIRGFSESLQASAGIG